MTSTSDPSPDLSEAYRDLRVRVDALVRAATPQQCTAVAPATPDWRVHDVLAHLVGVPADILAGRLDGVASDEWTEAQVAPRRALPTVALLEEWSRTGPQVEPMIPGFGAVAGQMVGDAVTHEHDIRDALDTPGARASTAVHIGSHWMANHMGTFHRKRGHGTLRIETDLWSETFGDDAPAATLRTSAFEILRAATGRRSTAQIAAYGWDGPAHPEIVVMPIFVPRAEDFDG
jgi:uncharacterized protein (TIGR03083 family)